MTPQQQATGLDRLHDIVLPPEPAAWPPAPGWIVLFLLLGIGVAAGVAVAVRRHRRERYRRLALAELERADVSRWPELVRRTALAAFPRERVVPLAGDAWLSFLDATANVQAFTAGPGRVLNELAYRPDVNALDDTQRGALRTTIAHWIRNHRRDA